MREPTTEERKLFAPILNVLEPDERFAAAFVFGSAARGELRADSDLDIATISPGHDPAGEWLDLVGRLAIDTGRDVHLVDLAQATHVLRFQVFRDGIRLFDGDPDATARLLERTLIERFDWLHAMDVMDRAMKRIIVREKG